MPNRIEYDSLGPVEIPEGALWGPQTERSRQNFSIGQEKMPLDVVYALVRLKKAAAHVNMELGKLEAERAQVIEEATDLILSGAYDEAFPLHVWQTGSGTQSNMNTNEVITHLASKIKPDLSVHPNDHVNMGQSSNDIFMSACHMAALEAVEKKLFPALDQLIGDLEDLSKANRNIIKVGRTHLQDATPLTLGQEISAWASMLKTNRSMLEEAVSYLENLAVGGTAVGTGLNTTEDFGDRVCQVLNRDGYSYKSASNKFQALSSKDALHFAHSGLEVLASNYHKIANDVRLLSMGPRAGIGEITIPANEPGSSIMPGKVNPTQTEQATMICALVIGHQSSISFASAMGQFQLNVYSPMVIYLFLQSTYLLAQSMETFDTRLVRGIKANIKKIEENLENSLMPVTALSPKIGYEKAAKIAQAAYKENKTVRTIALRELDLSPEEIDQLLDPSHMV